MDLGPGDLGNGAVFLVSLMALVAGCIQGTIGFGLGILATPLLALIDPAFVPVSVLISSWPISTLAVLRERHATDWHGVPWLIGGRIPGSIAGAALVALVAHAALGVAIALIVLATVAVSLSAPAFSPTRRTLVAAGVASGFMGTASSVGGAPVALAYQHEGGPRARSTMAAVFSVGTLLSILVLAIAGEVGRHELELTAVLLPGTVVGFALSGQLARRVDHDLMRRAVLVTASVAAVALLITSLA